LTTIAFEIGSRIGLELVGGKAAEEMLAAVVSRAVLMVTPALLCTRPAPRFIRYSSNFGCEALSLDVVLFDNVDSFANALSSLSG
jgi:hypothetical protein